MPLIGQTSGHFVVDVALAEGRTYRLRSTWTSIKGGREGESTRNVPEVSDETWPIRNVAGNIDYLSV